MEGGGISARMGTEREGKDLGGGGMGICTTPLCWAASHPELALVLVQLNMLFIGPYL